MKKQNRNETLKKRYQVYRKLGYDSKTARALSQRSLDVSSLELSSKTGKLKRNKTTKQFITIKMDQYKKEKAVDNYVSRTREITNDTNYTKHGLLTHDRRYKGENGKIVTIIKNENNLSRDQAYYFFYFMRENDLSYQDAKLQLMSNKDFEEYDRRKKQRYDSRKRSRDENKLKRQARKIEEWSW